ncbi:MAG TPA: hypothetical protein VFK16_03530 [Gemmatimonadaceae bacterium]|nr:hypothetical protein [Gemmatimonadaceae bacterium]
MRLVPGASLLLAATLAAAPSALAQGPTTDTSAFNQSADPLLASFRFRLIGPASMGGRIDDIAVAPTDRNVVYIGYATGGVFRSVDGATSFTPVFQAYGSASIGDVAIDPTNANIVYVGTGEANNRQSSSFGNGIYKSTDGGKTFVHMGLDSTQTIARIVIDPRNPRTVYVAAPGHLFGPNPYGAIYKTTDGGATWQKVKYIDENTGFIDIVMDPANSQVLFAASYQRRRTGCCYNGGGPGSGLWKTTDAGRSWTRLTGHGLPPGTYGRIGLDIARSNPKVMYAQIETSGAPTVPSTGGTSAGARGGGSYDWCSNAGPDHGFSRGRGFGPAPEASDTSNQADSTRVPPKPDGASSGVYRSSDGGRTWAVMNNCDGRPLYFSQIRVDPSNENTVWIGNVHPARSLDGGRTFLTLDDAGGFFNMMEDNHAFWIDPHDSKHVMRGSDAGFAVTWDQGATWEYVRTMATALAYWVTADMGHPYYVYAGFQDNDSWAGPSSTRSRVGIQNSDWFHLGGGDGFQTAVDPTDFHTVYAESQDGSLSRFDLRTGESKSIRPVAPPAPDSTEAGSGGGTAGAARAGASAAPSAPACVDGRIITPGGGAGGRGGFGFRRGGRTTSNVLNAAAGDSYRFNWNSPLLLSPHDPNIVWFGGNRLFKSYDKGNTWVASADLTRQVDRCDVSVMGAAGNQAQLAKNDGVSSYSTLTAISESPVIPGVVWAGTDDGNLQVSRDGGHTFTDVAKNLPGLPTGALDGPNPYWISRIDASHFDGGTAYVSVDGHRSDDMHPYIFVTRDYGRTFTPISGTLPGYGNVRVVREDPRNRNLLFAGTEFGLYVSLDAGAHWEKFMNGFPTVRVDDILIHPRDGDLVVATHGRSIWIADDITALQQFTPAVAAGDATLFDVRPAIAYHLDLHTDIDIGGAKRFEAANAPRGTAVSFYLKSDAGDSATVSILNATGQVLCTSTEPGSAGIHRVQWTLVEPLARDTAGAGRGGTTGRGGRGGRAPNPSCSAGGAGGRGGASGEVAPGTYVARLTVGGKTYTKPVTVLEDVWMSER